MLIIIDSLNNAGTENYLLNLMSSDKYSKDFSLLILNSGEIDNDILERFTLLTKRIDICSNSDNRYLFIFKLIKEKNIKIVHLHLYSSLLPIVLICKLLNVKIVSTFHMPLSKWGMKIRTTWIISSLLVDKLIAVSTPVKNELLKYRKSVEICNPPISISTNKDNCIKDYINIIGVGRLSVEKDWPTLLRATSLLREQKNTRVKICLCGDGPELSSLKELAKKLDMVNVCVFKGHLEHEAMLNELKNADFFVLPSKFEGFGIAPVEAMQMGIPTITANYPASDDYITHNKTGWKFEIGNAEELASLLLTLIENKVLRNNVANEGMKLARQKFDPEMIASKHLDIYQELLK